MAELEEFLNDDAKLNEAATNDTLISTLKNSAALIEAKDTVKNGDGSISAQVAIEVQRGIAQYLADNNIDPAHPAAPLDLRPGGSTHTRATDRIKISNHGMEMMVYRPGTGDGPGVKADGIFKNVAEYFQAVGKSYDKFGLTAKREQLREITNSAGTQIPGDGGFLVPDGFRDELLSVALESAVVRPRATVIPMSTLRLAMPAIDETTHSGSIRGGIQFFWGEEGAAFTETQASFGRVQLEAKKLYGYMAPPNELIAEAPAWSRFVDQTLPEGITWFEDIGFTNGSGVGEPFGWNNAQNGARIVYDVATSSQIAWADVVGMYARMLPSSLSRAVWLVSPDAFPQLAQMTFGTGSFPALFTVGGGTGTPFMSLLGRPVIVTEKVSALGTDGALAFVDLSYYLIGDRQIMQAEQSEHYLFGSDKTAIRITERVDGRPWIQSAITPQNGSTNTLSPFVVASGSHT
jgi:HK97 family phage major capsid protein